MNLLDEIEKKLKEINPNTKYAKIYDFDDLTDYNFLVFGKKGLRKLPDGKSLQNSFFVIIVNENYIEDSTVLSVIEKVQEIPGLRLAAGDFNYEYLRKGKTDFVVETLMLEFSKTLKRGGGFEYRCLVRDEDGKEKLKAYPNVTFDEFFTRKIENGAEEVAEVEATLAVEPDEHGQGLYEAPVSEVTDDNVISQWIENFSPELVRLTEI